MKKLVLSLSVAVAFGMVSCGDSNKENAEDSMAGVMALDSVQSSEGIIDTAVNDESEIIVVQEETEPTESENAAGQDSQSVEETGAAKAKAAKELLTPQEQNKQEAPAEATPEA